MCQTGYDRVVYFKKEIFEDFAISKNQIKFLANLVFSANCQINFSQKTMPTTKLKSSQKVYCYPCVNFHI